MGTKKAGEENVRVLVKSGPVSYSVTLPVEEIRKFRWQDGQKVVITADATKKQFVIRDWKGR